MRFIDIALAALIGTSAMAGMTIWSPRSPDASSQRLQSQWELRDTLLNHVLQQGTVIAIETEPQKSCEIVSTWADTNVGYTASVGGVPCGLAIPSKAVTASLLIQTPTGEVVLQAWSNAGA